MQEEEMKILLINPDPNPYVSTQKSVMGIPMAILAIGTYLKKNKFDIKIIDERFYQDGDIFRKIDDTIGSARLVGLSVMTAQIREALRISQYIKRKYSDKKIMWGGVHPTLFPQQTLQSPFVDFVVTGEGERTSLELARAIETTDAKSDFSDIKGLGFKRSGEIIITGRRELMPMDDIPPQEFDLLDVERYLNMYYPFIGIVRELLVQSSRGCPHQCAFCINYVERDYNIWRSKSPELVIDEIGELKERYKLNAISFRDENFFVNRKHAKGVIESLQGLNIRWFANVRADYFNETNVSGELLKLARDAGVAYLGIGAESGVDRILKLISKDTTVDQILFTAEQVNKYGIIASYSFIIGIPGETKADMEQTVKLMQKIKKICPRSVFSGPQILRPYPGGSLYDLCVEKGYSAPQSLEEWASHDSGKFGELSIKNYPWIKNPALVIGFSTYVPAALNYDFMKKLDFKRKVYTTTALLRLRFNFWFFPYEYQFVIKVIKHANIIRRWILRFFFEKEESK